MGIAHWDEVETVVYEAGPMRAEFRDLGSAAGSRGVGVKRVFVRTGRFSTPPHVHSREEEMIFVLAGSGLLWLDGATCELRPGDCVVLPPAGAAHALVGGDEALDALVYGPRLKPEADYLPRANRVWLGEWPLAVDERRPWQIEAELGDFDVPRPGERPANVVNLEDAPAEFGGASRRLGGAAGSEQTGLNWVTLPPGEEGAPPHCHSAEEEIFVILDGEGILDLWPAPAATRLDPNAAREEQPVRAGHVIARPPGTRVGHTLRAAPERSLTYLAYGTREPSDLCYYPRSNKIFFRGLGLIGRLEHLDYWDGEPG